MRIHQVLIRRRLLILCLAIACLVVVFRHFQHVDDVHSSSEVPDDSAKLVALHPNPTHERSPTPTPAPRLATALSRTSLDNESREISSRKEASKSKNEREQFFAEERAIMAKAWKLSLDQTADFEVAARDAYQERADVFKRMESENPSAKDFSAQLAAANDRINERFLRILGPERLLEYDLTYGHFVEMGLEHKPFVPPTVSYESTDETHSDQTDREPAHTTSGSL